MLRIADEKIGTILLLHRQIYAILIDPFSGQK